MRDVRWPHKRLKHWTLPAALFLGVFLVVATTVSEYGLTWDEPHYFQAAELHIQWVADFWKNLFSGQVAKSLPDEVIQASWRWDPYHVPHPPFPRLLSGLTKTLFSPFIDKFTAYRLATPLFFTLLVTVMYLWMAALFDRMTGLFSALTLVLMPNLFAQAHFVMTDMPLTAMWFATVYCFVKGLKDWRWSLVLGIVWGLALATKFPAFLIPIPLLLWAHLYHRRSYTNNIFAMVFLSPLTMIACQPYLWHRTLTRIVEFLLDGVNRGYRLETNFAIFFFNQLYTTSTVPWYYPFFMTGVTVPETILALTVVGLIAMSWLQSQRDIMVLFLFNAVFLLSTGLLPGAVLHDVNRLMLPVLPFVAGLAGCGFFFLMKYLIERCQSLSLLQAIKHLGAKLVGTVSLLLLFPPALDLVTYHPYQLSYYNRLVGGIRGAHQQGLEVTYLMDAFNPEFFQFINQRLPANAVINGAFGNSMFQYYQRENRLRPDIRITDGNDFDYYILLNRQSTFLDFKKLVSHLVHPFATIHLGGVPLVYIYEANPTLRESRNQNQRNHHARSVEDGALASSDKPL